MNGKSEQNRRGLIMNMELCEKYFLRNFKSELTNKEISHNSSFSNFGESISIVISGSLRVSKYRIMQNKQFVLSYVVIKLFS